MKTHSIDEFSPINVLSFFRREIKKLEKIPKDELEPLLFAIAYQSDRKDFEACAKYVLKRF